MKKINILFLLLILAFVRTVHAANLVSNSGFETVETYVGPWSTMYGVWKGDISQVVGAENGITPVGTGMFKFVNTRWGLGYPNGQSGDLVQFIDISPYAGLISSGNARARFSAHYNRIADDGSGVVDDAFSVRLFARAGIITNFNDNVPASLAFNEALLASDNDPSTWELASETLDIPAGTTYLAIMLRATENRVNDVTNEFAGHYADNISVHFVPEPSLIFMFFLFAVSAVCLRVSRELPLNSCA